MTRVLANRLAARLTAQTTGTQTSNVAGGAGEARNRVALLNMHLVLLVYQDLATKLAFNVRTLAGTTAALTVLELAAIVATKVALCTTSARKPVPAAEAEGVRGAEHHEESNNREDDSKAHLAVLLVVVGLFAKSPLSIYTFI